VFRSLSPEAVCTAVLPLSEVVVNEMPQRLRSRWESLQSALAPDSFHAMHQLQQLYNSSANFAGNKSEDYDLAELKNWNNLVNYSSIIGSIKQVNRQMKEDILQSFDYLFNYRYKFIYTYI
jgi:alkanesulfonate monooxygenase SsuD/methylene tetrahydromethanopterin reductase-like flavin-dependent oxidoreductase (luciferase family)